MHDMPRDSLTHRRADNSLREPPDSESGAPGSRHSRGESTGFASDAAEPKGAARTGLMRLLPAFMQRRTVQRPARLSVSVPPEQGEGLRCALFQQLGQRIKWIVVSSRVELGARETVLDLVLDPDAIGQALHVVTTTASCARLGLVPRRSTAATPAARGHELWSGSEAPAASLSHAAR